MSWRAIRRPGRTYGCFSCPASCTAVGGRAPVSSTNLRRSGTGWKKAWRPPRWWSGRRLPPNSRPARGPSARIRRKRSIRVRATRTRRRTSRVSEAAGSFHRPERALSAGGPQVLLDRLDDVRVAGRHLVLFARIGLQIVDLEGRVFREADRFPSAHSHRLLEAALVKLPVEEGGGALSYSPQRPLHQHAAHPARPFR